MTEDGGWVRLFLKATGRLVLLSHSFPDRHASHVEHRVPDPVRLPLVAEELGREAVLLDRGSRFQTGRPSRRVASGAGY